MVADTGELKREFMRRASACGLETQVLMDGSMNAEIAVIAEAPGEREKEKRTPLVGGAGKFLWDNLRRFDITRQHCYCTNVVKRQLAQVSGNKSPINKNELSHWEGLLEWELSQLPNVQYVLLLGNYALRALTLEQKITDWRGSVLDVKLKDNRKVKAVCAFNPAHVLREPKWEPIFRFDMNKLKRVMDGTYKPYEMEHFINPSYNEAVQWINKMHDDKTPISFDIETISGETACVGLANENHRGVCINFRDGNRNRYSTTEERDLHRRMQRLFHDKTTRLVAQNANFDSYWLWYKDRIKVPQVWFDTLLAHHTLYPGLPHNLGFLTAQYTDHPFYKDEGKDWREGGNIDDFWRYNVKDVCITRAVMDQELQELRDQGLEDFFFNHVMRLQPHLVMMTVLGVKCDVELKQRIAEELHEALAEKRKEFDRAVYECTNDPNYVVNPKSPKQLQDLIFNRLRLVGRGTSTDKENRTRIMKHPRTPEPAKRMLRTLDEFSKDSKFLSTYAEMEVDEDERIRCEYKQYGVAKAPGRLSSAQTMWGSGMNLQNQPERAYKMFVADPGYEFVYFDLSQAEARVVAYKSPVPALKENFALADQGRADVHRANAARIFGKDYEDIPTADRNEDGSPTERYLGKRCVHGLNYRMGPDRLATVCNIPLWQAEQAYNAYHRAFPEIKEWWDDILQEVRKTRTLYNAYGRRLLLMGRLDEDALESVVAFYPQSTIGDKVARCIYLCHEDPDWPRRSDGTLQARMVLNVHDALIALARPSEREQVMHVMKKHAEEPLYIRGEELVIPAEFAVSKPDEDGVHRWSTLEKLK
jgi:uracil-DNA glycosylase family 4